MSFTRAMLLRRTFWKFAGGTVRSHVVSAERWGFFFKHNQVSYRLAGTVNGGEDILAAAIADKHSDAAQNLVGKVVLITYEQHVFGAPWKGNVVGPIYAKAFTICGSTDTMDDK